MADYRTPTDLLGLERSPILQRMMRACGVEEARISGGASHMDKFLALSEVMPLCRGHEAAEAVHRTLREAIGLSAPLCPHNARMVWSAWVDRYWYRREGETMPLPETCSICACPSPLWVGEEKRVLLPEATTVKGGNLGTWTRAWESHLESATRSADVYPLFSLPETYAFRRPDPYHAGAVIGKLADCQPLSDDEACLLITQALRVWGQWSLRERERNKPPLLLCGGHAPAVRDLLGYLDTSRALAPLVWIPREPAEAREISGLYGCVGTGVALSLSSCPTPEEREALTRAYRRGAPWGMATVI